MKYSIYYIGSPMLGNPRALVDSVFPQYEQETLAGRASIESGGNSCTVTFDSPQTSVDLGPLVKVEVIPTP
ncbi:MAG: hypothetical protein EBR82_82205 [Caulobacteraceae bacterium]|nr:hypothetical protein [Caulobacteraceae bacterium]